MESEDREAVAAASNALSRTINEHAPANRRPENVMAEMVEHVGRRTADEVSVHVVMTDHDSHESPEQLMSGFQPLTPPTDAE